MLTSSWFVASGIRAARMNSGRRASILFLLTVLCGIGFGVVKFFEYSAKIHAGITLNTNDFFMCYFMFTGIHLFHVLIGTILVSLMARYSWTGPITSRKIYYLETGATYWHLVDLLWIVLFALLYLVK
jgi:nitric oxide reductase NorE protein